MIKIKERPPVPPTLAAGNVAELKERIAEKINAGDQISSEDFKAYWLKDDVRATLWELQNKKCCYCERKRELKYESDVEHYRLKAAVKEESTHPGYWWLAYAWDNYLYACKPCNEAHKKNKFPLMPGGIRAQGPGDSLSDEKPYLVNPIDEDPKNYIGFVWEHSEELFVKAVGLDNSRRGEETIRLTQLNRTDVMEERAGLILSLRLIVSKMLAGKYFDKPRLQRDAAAEIKSETSAEKPFAGFRRAFFRAHGLGEFVSND